jgi:hypothetical protein
MTNLAPLKRGQLSTSDWSAIAKPWFKVTGSLILRSGIFAASRRMGYSVRGPWFETALARLLTTRSVTGMFVIS